MRANDFEKTIVAAPELYESGFDRLNLKCELFLKLPYNYRYPHPFKGSPSPGNKPTEPSMPFFPALLIILSFMSTPVWHVGIPFETFELFYFSQKSLSLYFVIYLE